MGRARPAEPRRPRVGETVQYFTRDQAEQLWGSDSGPYAAIVTKRREGSLVALAVLTPFSAKVHAVGWVRHQGERADATSWWAWPGEAGQRHDIAEAMSPLQFSDRQIGPKSEVRTDFDDLEEWPPGAADDGSNRRQQQFGGRPPLKRGSTPTSRRQPPARLQQLRLPM